MLVTVKNKGAYNGLFKDGPLPELFRQDEINLPLDRKQGLNGTYKSFPTSVFLIRALMSSPPVPCKDDPAQKEALH